MPMVYLNYGAVQVRIDSQAGTIEVKDAGGQWLPIGGGGLPDGAVTTAKLADEAVTTAKVADGSITDSKVGQLGIKVQGLLPLTTAQRDALVNPPANAVIYNLTTGKLEKNSGTPGAPSWDPVVTAGLTAAQVRAIARRY